MTDPETDPEAAVDARQVIRLPIEEPGHLALMNQLFGAAQVLEAIEGAEHAKLPGMGYAKSLAELVVSKLRLQFYSQNIKVAARAGVNLDSIRQVSLSTGDPAVVELQLYDLADLAESGGSGR